MNSCEKSILVAACLEIGDEYVRCTEASLKAAAGHIEALRSTLKDAEYSASCFSSIMQILRDRLSDADGDAVSEVKAVLADSVGEAVSRDSLDAAEGE